jgi:hypothetical protein
MCSTPAAAALGEEAVQSALFGVQEHLGDPGKHRPQRVRLSQIRSDHLNLGGQAYGMGSPAGRAYFLPGGEKLRCRPTEVSLTRTVPQRKLPN